MGMNRNFVIGSFWIVLVSFLVSYLTIAYVNGDWNMFAWKTPLVEDSKFLGEVVLVALFILFRKKLKGD